MRHCIDNVGDPYDPGALIDRLHAAIGHFDAVILNPGALSHYSYALHDTITSVALPTIEVHLSDITAREPWRSHSVISAACVATIVGEGPDGYRRAMEMLADGPHPGDIAVGRDEKAAGRPLGARGIRQKVCYSLVEGHLYLDSVRIDIESLVADIHEHRGRLVMSDNRC